MNRCPTCGHVTGYTMETHPDMPGVLDWLRGDRGEVGRWVMAAVVLVLITLFLVATRSVF